jgi:hypothetical protein
MMKKFMFVLAMVCIFINKPAMATYQYSFEGVPGGSWSISWSWEFSSASIFSTSTEVAGNMLTESVTPAGYDIVKVSIGPGSLAWVNTYFDTTGDGAWDIGYGVGFEADITQVGFFTRITDGNTLKISEAVVPEPATLALLGIALAGIGATRRKIAI